MKRLFLISILMVFLFAATPMRDKQNAQATKAGFSLTQKNFNKSPQKITAKIMRPTHNKLISRPAFQIRKVNTSMPKKRVQPLLPNHPKLAKQPMDRQVR